MIASRNSKSEEKKIRVFWKGKKGSGEFMLLQFAIGGMSFLQWHPRYKQGGFLGNMETTVATPLDLYKKNKGFSERKKGVW